MDTARKITVEIPQHLLEKAQQASGTGITQTVRTGLQLVAASQAYKRLRGFARQSSLHSHSGRAESRQMIAAETSTWIAFLEGEQGKDAQLLDKALSDRQVLMVPVVLTELLSDPQLPPDVAETLAEVPMVDLGAGYWQRAGALRAKVLSKRRKARLGDALIAQTCLDRGIPLLTRDKAFLAFVEAARLDLVV